jgi:spore germination protein KC
MKKIKVICFLMLVCSMVFLTGCWNYREIDTLSIVSGLAIDKGEQGAKYRVTFELLDLSAGSKNAAKPKLTESEGDTVFDAVRNVVKSSDKKLFFSDCKIVVISSDLAKDGIQPILDWFARDTEPRITLNLLVSQENTAADILKKEASPDDISSYKISNMLDHDAAFLSKAPQTKLYEAYNILDGKGVSLILPCIKTPVLKSGPTLDLSGTAMFKKDKLIGFLNNDESKFLLFVNDKIKGGMLLTNMDSNQNNITLEISSSKTKVTPVISNDQVTMKINITTKVAMAEDNTGGKLTQNAIEDIQKSAEKTLVDNVTTTIKKVQGYDSDIFGFGSAVYRSDSAFWKKVEPEWDKQFASLKCDVTAKVEIENTATAKVKEKGGD